MLQKHYFSANLGLSSILFFLHLFASNVLNRCNEATYLRFDDADEWLNSRGKKILQWAGECTAGPRDQQTVGHCTDFWCHNWAWDSCSSSHCCPFPQRTSTEREPEPRHPLPDYPWSDPACSGSWLFADWRVCDPPDNNDGKRIQFLFNESDFHGLITSLWWSIWDLHGNHHMQILSV